MSAVGDARKRQLVEPVFEQADIYVVEGPRGFTESFDKRTVETLVALGLIQHKRDGHVMQDGYGAPIGPLHRFYAEVTR